MTIRLPRSNFRGLTRRRFLSTAAAAGVGAIAMPHLSRAADRPQITHGVQSGDISVDGGVVWARADRPSQMLVEVSTTESFKDVRKLPPIAALPESDFTAKMLVEDMQAMGPVRLRDVDEAQALLVNIAKDLAAKGEILISKSRGEDELIY